MATLLIEMPSGIAGDMLLAALVALGGDIKAVQKDLEVLGLGPIRIQVRRAAPSGISALQVDVQAEQNQGAWVNAKTKDAGGRDGGHTHHSHHHEHDQAHSHDHTHHHHDHGDHVHDDHGAHGEHRPYRVIRELLDTAPLAARVKERAQRIFKLLGEAEAEVHGVGVDEVLFHEVGGIDAIADVVGCCLLLEQLGIDRVVSSALLPGEGYVNCAHGRMPVPVPAVAALLAKSGAPHRRLGRDTGELTTPTGCALVLGLVDAWLDDQAGDMAISKVGYGAGHKTIPGLTNLVRCSLLRETGENASDQVAELRCQVDDATGEQLATLADELIAAGANDAYLCPVIMKKGRPGCEITVLCAPGERQRFADLLLSRSTSIGLRWQILRRQLLPRRQDSVQLGGETIGLKVVILPDGSERAKPDADAVTAASRKLGRPFADVQQAALAVWRARKP